MSNSSSPRTPPKPANRHPEAPILEPLNEGDQQRGEIIATATGGREGLERPFMQDARDLEREGGGEKPQQPHRRQADLRERGAQGESDTHEHRPGDVLDETRDDWFESQKIPEAGPQQDKQSLHRQAEQDRQPGYPQERGPKGGWCDAKGSPSQNVVAGPCEEYTPDPRSAPSFGVRLVFFWRSAVSYSSLLICQIPFLCLLLANSLATPTG